jgi:hypothetical protein
MLADPKHGVEGLTLPRGSLIRDQTFADDTALYLQGSLANLDRVQDLLPRVRCQGQLEEISDHLGQQERKTLGVGGRGGPKMDTKRERHEIPRDPGGFPLTPRGKL